MSGASAHRVHALAGDEELMAAVVDGEVASFEELHNRFAARAHRVARGICRDHGRAEEAVQDAFVSVWNTGRMYEPARGTVAAWLLSVVRYRALDVARRNDRHARRRADDEGEDQRHEASEVHETIVAREDSAELSSRLRRLPPAQREVIRLAFYGQLTHVEIAAQLGLPEGTVKGRARLGLQKLRAGGEAGGAGA